MEQEYLPGGGALEDYSSNFKYQGGKGPSGRRERGRFPPGGGQSQTQYIGCLFSPHRAGVQERTQDAVTPVLEVALQSLITWIPALSQKLD